MEKVFFLIILFLFPLLGKVIDFNESIFFYSLPSILIFYTIFIKKEDFRLKQKPAILLGILVLLFLISTILSKNFGGSYSFVFIFINCLLMALVMIKNISQKDFQYGLSISTLIFSVVFLLDKIKLISLETSPLNDNVIKQIYGHSYLADLLVLVFPFILFKIGTNLSKTKKILNFLSLVFFFVTLITTHSRSGVIAVVVGLFFINSQNKIQKIIKTLIISLSLMFFIISLTPKYQNQFDKTTTGQRNQYWLIAFKGFTKSPLFGNGPNTFPIIRKSLQYKQITTNLAHNSILNFLCENGIFFTAIFLLAIYYGLTKTRKTNNIFFVTSIIAITHSLLDPTWNSPGIFIISLYLIFYNSSIFIDQPNKKTPFSPVILGLSLLCFLFFIFDTISTNFFLRKNYQASLIFNPFNLDSRLGIITENDPKSENWQKNLDFTLKYFNKNEVVYQKLIGVTPFPQNEKYYYSLFELNSKEPLSYYSKLIKESQKNNDPSKIERVLSYINDNFNENEMPSIYAIPISKESYNYAIRIYPKDKTKSLDFFRLSVKLVPNSGYYQVDLANALWNSDQKQNAINQLSINCQEYIYAKEQCQTYLSGHQYTNFNQPGNEEYTTYINDEL